MLFFVNEVTYSQDCRSWLKKEKLKYSFGIISAEYNAVENTYVPSTYVVNVDLDSTQKECISLLSYNDWISLLNDSTTNISTNILLYFLYQKDALLKYSSYKRNGGRFKMSKDDILYWSECLKKGLPSISTDAK